MHDIRRGLGEQVDLPALVGSILWHAEQFFDGVGAAFYLAQPEGLRAIAGASSVIRSLGEHIEGDRGPVGRYGAPGRRCWFRPPTTARSASR
ncbi:hypothetical protein [Nannocystis pusilla]|uniref:hypothetical protein n=1 Tax=Nannocystis pusilla TaxID=889268 RepID=UPI003B7AEDF2